MGWSDISINLRGPAVEDLKAHFVERWNFIYKEKYDVRKDSRYSEIAVQQSTHGLMKHMKSGLHNFEAQVKQLPTSDSPTLTYAIGAMKDRITNRLQQAEATYLGEAAAPHSGTGVACQVVRSCTNWSHGVDTEHSIANAYISIIRDSQHFIYIENQFFITATTSSQKPVLNKLGAAILERILRAAKAGEKYMIIVVIPAVPGFAGDLKDESSLGTRSVGSFSSQRGRTKLTAFKTELSWISSTKQLTEAATVSSSRLRRQDTMQMTLSGFIISVIMTGST